MADEAIEPESSTQNPLVTVTFQRDPNRKQKYLEAEPKALGITQILLSVHQIASQSILPPTAYYPTNEVPYYVALVVVMVAGSVAIAAKNLHLPTLQASFGMQLLSSGASFFNVIWILVDLDTYYDRVCWRYAETNTTEQTCKDIEHVKKLVFGQKMIIQVALFAISVTLAIYACKVINCCGPAGKMPVITVQTPPPAESSPVPDPLQ
ncbi:membrane-spanning 4-domains subfamily A member 4A [Syngnathus scovelli]|uniref:membrane-spanning 4-domains subfamily A member 4A n=1 Tax=Syngnathus scovelli TaxID=161590 RepID=UPI00210FD24B|nr:uncharacterized protein LOC125983959 [Syngnathus scovelli]